MFYAMLGENARKSQRGGSGPLHQLLLNQGAQVAGTDGEDVVVEVVADIAVLPPGPPLTPRTMVRCMACGARGRIAPCSASMSRPRQVE